MITDPSEQLRLRDISQNLKNGRRGIFAADVVDWEIKMSPDGSVSLAAFYKNILANWDPAFQAREMSPVFTLKVTSWFPPGGAWRHLPGVEILQTQKKAGK